MIHDHSGGHDPKVENHRYKILTAEELRTMSIRKLRGRVDKDVEGVLLKKF